MGAALTNSLMNCFRKLPHQRSMLMVSPSLAHLLGCWRSLNNLLEFLWQRLCKHRRALSWRMACNNKQHLCQRRWGIRCLSPNLQLAGSISISTVCSHNSASNLRNSRQAVELANNIDGHSNNTTDMHRCKGQHSRSVMPSIMLAGQQCHSTKFLKRRAQRWDSNLQSRHSIMRVLKWAIHMFMDMLASKRLLNLNHRRPLLIGQVPVLQRTGA